MSIWGELVANHWHSDEELESSLMLIGEAYAQGMFSRLEGGLTPLDYVDDGFYHFGAEYDIVNKSEFDSIGWYRESF